MSLVMDYLDSLLPGLLPEKQEFLQSPPFPEFLSPPLLLLSLPLGEEP